MFVPNWQRVNRVSDNCDEETRLLLATPPRWEFCVAALFMIFFEFGVAAWLPGYADARAVSILFLPAVAILAAYDGLLAGMLGIALSIVPEAYFLSGRQWGQLPTGSNLQDALGFIVIALLLALTGSILRATAR